MTTTERTGADPKVEYLEEAVIRFAGDSGDGMQLTGNQFTNSAALFGDGLHVVTEDIAAAQEEIRRGLSALDVPIWRLEQVMPSIEDVFVSLVEQVDRELNQAGRSDE